MISVIIPLYNKSQCIYRTIQSVLEQTYTDFEIVVINDGSTDEGPLNVQKIDDNRIRLITQPNAGVSAARNRGVREAKGEWILFLDADDCLLPTCLEILFGKVLLIDNLNIVCGNYYKTKKGEKKLYSNHKREGVVRNRFRSYFFSYYSMRMGCALMKKEMLIHYSFDERLSRFEDMKWILDLLRDDNRIYVTPEVVMEYKLDYTELSRVYTDKAKDFTYNLTFVGKTFWEKCCLGKLLYFASFTYVDDVTLRTKYNIYYCYRYIASVLLKLNNVKNILCQ